MLWIGLAVLLLLPVIAGLRLLGEPGYGAAIASTVGIVGMFIASSSLAARWRWAWAGLATVLLLCILFVRVLFFGLIRFSGEAFGSNFFIHLEPESVRVAWQQYGYLFGLFGLGVAVLLGLLAFAAKGLWVPRRRVVAGLVVVSGALIAIGYQGAPGWRLLEATRQWYAPKQLNLPAERMAVWRKSPLVNTSLVTRQKLSAVPADPPRNLILLYIESGGLAFAESDRYPDLMPFMKGLIAKDSLVDHLHASSYITIEGIVNTQCGTLFPFEEGSDSLAGFDTLMEEMPCLGDVLSAAGYQQTFLGGADKRFAGKGRFLSIHGYDKVWGFEDWRAHGFNQRKGTWGLSDADLFAQSIPEIERLSKSGKPYNLTMLTIGTHLPGFSYKECAPYHDGVERFLNAVHCTDQLIERWIGTLRTKGLLDAHTLLVITGDHQMFPNSEMKRLFGAETVYDRRLPLVILGNHPPAAVKHGAGYDIAPTLLDLLGVQSNVRFALGRSLMRPAARTLDYFVTRYKTILGESVDRPGEIANCATNNRRIPGEQSLSNCEREELATILRSQASAYSAPPVRMFCSGMESLRLRIPRDGKAALSIMVSGSEQAHRFTWQERHVDNNRPGLFLMALDRDGKLLSRDFAPAQKAAQVFAKQPKLKGAAVLVVAWRPDGKTATMPEWMQNLHFDSAGGGIYAVGPTGELEQYERVPAGSQAEVSSAQCKALLAGQVQRGS